MRQHQLKINYDLLYDERMNVLRAKLKAITPEFHSVGDAMMDNVRECVMAHYAFCNADPDRYTQATPERLWARANMSKSAFYRARSKAVEIGYLRTQRERVRQGEKRPPDRVYIEHGAIERDASSCREATGNSWDQVGIGGNRWEHNNDTQKPNYPITQKTQSDSGGRVFDYVSEKLVHLRVAKAEPLAESFEAAGGTVEAFDEILDYFRTKTRCKMPAWRIGGLVTKIERWYPDCPVDDGWPPECEKHREYFRRMEIEAKRKLRAEEINASAKLRDQRKAELAAIDKESKAARAEILKWTKERREVALDTCMPGWRQFFKHDSNMALMLIHNSEVEKA